MCNAGACLSGLSLWAYSSTALYELESKCLVSPLVTPILLPYISLLQEFEEMRHGEKDSGSYKD